MLQYLGNVGAKSKLQYIEQVQVGMLVWRLEGSLMPP